MNLRSAAVLLLGVVLLTALVGGGLFAVQAYFTGQSYASSYRYDATIATNATLTNATLYLPVPTRDGEPLFDAATVAVERSTPSSDVAVDWNATLVETDRGPMLALTAAEIEGRPRYVLHEFYPNGTHAGWREIEESEIPADMTNKKLYVEPTVYRITVWTSVDDRVDVAAPVSNASVMRPVENVSVGACTPYWDEEDVVCSTYDGRAYASYRTADDNAVHLSLELAGTNEWGFALSNSFNEFVQRADADLPGSQSGWVRLDGELHTGLGDERR
ncbi:MAG: hypothetical protein ABEJ23_04730 [Haloarculaceae archaeon]